MGIMLKNCLKKQDANSLYLLSLNSLLLNHPVYDLRYLTASWIFPMKILTSQSINDAIKLTEWAHRMQFIQGIIHWVRTRNVRENYHFLPPWHAHLRKRINQGVRDVSFSESFANVLNELVLILKSSV